MRHHIRRSPPVWPQGGASWGLGVPIEEVSEDSPLPFLLSGEAGVINYVAPDQGFQHVTGLPDLRRHVEPSAVSGEGVAVDQLKPDFAVGLALLFLRILFPEEVWEEAAGSRGGGPADRLGVLIRENLPDGAWRRARGPRLWIGCRFFFRLEIVKEPSGAR